MKALFKILAKALSKAGGSGQPLFGTCQNRDGVSLQTNNRAVTMACDKDVLPLLSSLEIQKPLMRVVAA